jgi:hypothetical protein
MISALPVGDEFVADEALFSAMPLAYDIDLP